MSHYYNEFNPESAAMLRQMISDGLLPAGDVDERSITDVRPEEIKHYTQCHFFAGIGGWQFALQHAGWDSTRPVWTGSCPCQPFSTAGKQSGTDDERHLLPAWASLVAECRPPTIFGEQVAAAVAHGWLDELYQRLGEEGYAIGAAVLPACSVGAPHRRDRLWFVADAEDKQCDVRGVRESCSKGCSEWEVGRRCCIHGIPTLANGDAGLSQTENQEVCPRGDATDVCGITLGDAKQQRLEGLSWHEPGERRWENQERPTATSGFWDSGELISCPDGKQRVIEPSIPLLAHGFQHRKPLLHAFGNAIVPQVGAAFIRAYMQTKKMC